MLLSLMEIIALSGLLLRLIACAKSLRKLLNLRGNIEFDLLARTAYSVSTTYGSSFVCFLLQSVDIP